jgi:hypothetical protein
VKRNTLEVYALVACFVSMIILIVSTAMSMNDFLRVVAPSVTIGAYAHEASRSDEEFMQSWPQGRPAPEPSTLSRLRKEGFERALRAERHDGLKSFLQTLMYAIAAGLMFRLHWSLAHREHIETAASAV